MTTPQQPPDESIGDDLASLDADVLAETIDDLAALREASDEREDALRASLREWGKREYGSFDAFAVAVGERAGVTFSHVRNALFYAKSARIVGEALALYRERTAVVASPTTPTREAA